MIKDYNVYVCGLPFAITDENNLIKSIPIEILSLRKMELLRLGKIAPSITLLKEYEWGYFYFYLQTYGFNFSDRNKLTGTIPTEIAWMQSLKFLLLGKVPKKAQRIVFWRLFC